MSHAHQNINKPTWLSNWKCGFVLTTMHQNNTICVYYDIFISNLNSYIVSQILTEACQCHKSIQNPHIAELGDF